MANVILGVSVSPNQPLMEAGLDSLAATEMHNAISNSFGGYEIPATFVFDYPTIDAMAQYLYKSNELATATLIPVKPQETQEHDFQSSKIVGMSCRYPIDCYGKTETHFCTLATRVYSFATSTFA